MSAWSSPRLADRSILYADRGWPMIKAGLQYLLFKSGPVSTTGVETCAFYDLDGNNDRPTIQLFCVPTVYLDRDVMGTELGDGVTINSLLLRPKAPRIRNALPAIHLPIRLSIRRSFPTPTTCG